MANASSTQTVSPTVTWHWHLTKTRTPGWWKTETSTRTSTAVYTATGTRTPGTATDTPTETSIPRDTSTPTLVPYESLQNPHSLSAQVEGLNVNLSWRSPTHGQFRNPTDYRIYRSNSADGFYQQVGDLSAAGETNQFIFSYTDNPGAGDWCYEIKAFNNLTMAESNPSNEACLSVAGIPTATFTATPTHTNTVTITPTPYLTPTYTATLTPTQTPTAAVVAGGFKSALAVRPLVSGAPCDSLPQWSGAGVAYSVGVSVVYGTEIYVCIQAHTSEITWDPPAVPALWQDGGACSGPTSTPNCTGATVWSANSVNYTIGQKVTYGTELYVCVQSHTSNATWTPPSTPNLWQDLGACPAMMTSTFTATLTKTFTITPTYTVTNTPTISLTPTKTGTNTSTHTATNSATNTAMNTATNTVTKTSTTTATNTPTNTATNTATKTTTNTFTNSATATSTATASNTATRTATNTASNTATSSATNSATNTATPSSTNSPTNTGTSTATNTASNTATATNSATSTATNTSTSTFTNTATQTATNSATNTSTNSSTATNTSTNSATSTSTNTATNTSTGTATSTSSPTNTETSSPTASYTNTATNSSTNTATNTATDSSTATATQTATNSATNTATNIFTNTATNTSTDSATNSPTNTATSTATNSATNTSTNSATNTVAGTSTDTASNTPSATNTLTSTPTDSPTVTLTATNSATNTGTIFTSTITNTPTVTLTNTVTITPTPTNTFTITYTPINCEVATVTDASMNGPEGVGLDSNGNIYEIESGSGQLQVFNSAGVSIHSWNGSSSGTAFNDPEGIAVDAVNKLVYVSDTGNARVVVFGTTGYVTQWSTSINNQESYPEQLAVPGDGYVYVADAAAGLILKYQTNGTFTTSFAGSGAGLLDNPTGVALDNAGNIYAADQGTNQVVVLTSGGVVSNTWGSFGSNGGQFMDPEEVSIDPNTNNVYVADAGNQRVQEFTHQGIFINSFTGQTPYEPAFGNPAGLFVLNANQIYVADSAGNDIAVIGSCFGIESPTPTNTSTPWPSLTPTPTGTVFTPTFTSSPTDTGTFSPTSSATNTPTCPPSNTPTPLTPVTSPTITYLPGICLAYSQSFTSPNENYINGSALDSSTNLYLAQNDIVVLNSSGQQINEFGSANLQFPEGIAVNNSLSLIYVVDANTNLVDVFNMGGAYQTSFGTLTNAGTMDNPTGIALDSLGNVYVADTDNDQFDVFTPAGAAVTTITGLNSPEGIAVDGSGNIYVGEAGLAQISKFNSSYQFQTSFNGNNTLGEPYEMKIDSHQLLWVADTQNDQIMAFDRSGNLLNSFTGPEIGGTVFDQPMVSIDANNNVYVPNTTGGLVQVFASCHATRTFTPTATGTSTGTPTNTAVLANVTATNTPTGTLATCTPTGSATATPTFTFTPVPTWPTNQYAARIAVGSDNDYYDTQGNDWIADQPYVQGNGAGWVVDAQDYYTTSPVINTSDPQLYQNFAEDTDIEYKFDVAPGTYQVTLKMMNTDYFQAGQGVFNVTANGTAVVSGLDLYNTGYFSAYDVTFTVNVSGTTLDLVWTPTAGLATVSAIQVLGTQAAAGPVTGPTPCFTPGFSWAGRNFGPTMLAYNKDGNVYAYSGGVMFVFAPNGSLLRNFNLTGVNNPTKMVSGTDGNLYIADAGANQVVVINTSGTVLSPIAAGQLNGPQGIAVGPNGNIYIADYGNNRVVEYQENGTFVQQFGTGVGGLSLGEIASPSEVAVDKNLNVYAWGAGNDSLSLFSSNGTPLRLVPNNYALAANCLKVDLNGNLWAGNASSLNLIGANLSVVETIGSSGGALNQFRGISEFNFDPYGNIYIADAGNTRIVKWYSCSSVPTPTPTVAAAAAPCVTPGFTWSANNFGPTMTAYNSKDGNIYAYSGGVMFVFSANSSFLRSFNLTGVNSPAEMVTGTDGNLYIADSGASQVVAINTAGTVLRNIGTGQLNGPQGIGIDPNGNIYVADTGNNRVMEYQESGAPVTQFGAGSVGNFLGQLSGPTKVAVDKYFNVFVWDNGNTRFEVFNSSSLAVTTFTESGLNTVGALRTDFKGNVWAADDSNKQIDLLNTSGAIVESFGTPGSGVNEFINIGGFAFDPTGNVYVADPGNARMAKWFICAAAPTATPTVVAAPTPCLNAQSSWGASPLIPIGLKYGQDGNIYLSNITQSNGSPLPGNGIQVYTTAGLFLRQVTTYGSGPSQTNNPNDIAQNIDGNLYIADTGNNRVLGVNIYGNPVTILGAKQLGAPLGVATDLNGDIFVADSNNNRVLEYQENGAFLRQLGSGAAGTFLNQLNDPTKITVDNQLNVYVWEAGNGRFTVYNASGVAQRIITVPAGTAFNAIRIDSNGFLWGSSAASGNNYQHSILVMMDQNGSVVEQIGGPGAAVNEFNGPQGFDFDSSGNMYVSDPNLNRVDYWMNCASASPTPTPALTPAASPYVLNVDVGSAQSYTDNSGNVWLADQAYSSGVYGYAAGDGGQLGTSNAVITGTNSPSLYQTYRYGANLSYDFNVPDGHYQVTLDFVDLLSHAAGQNVFNITANGTVVAQNVDIYKAVGGGVAADRSFRVEVTGNTPLSIQLTAVTGDAFVSAIAVTGSQPYIAVNPLYLYLLNPGGPALLP